MGQGRLPRVPSRTTPGFAFSILDRVLREHIAQRSFGPSEREKVLEFFGPDDVACVFCGSTDVRRWDHLVAIRNGGDTVAGNMVLACGPCDDSKRNLAFEKWMVGTAPKSPRSRGVADVERRLQRLRDYMSNFGYRPTESGRALSTELVAENDAIREDLSRLRSRVQAFIDRVAEAKRSGHPAT